MGEGHVVEFSSNEMMSLWVQTPCIHPP
jgi:hypothetical protein